MSLTTARLYQHTDNKNTDSSTLKQNGYRSVVEDIMILHDIRLSGSMMALIYLTIFTLVLSFGVASALAQDFNFNLSNIKGNSSFDLSFFCLSKDCSTEDISSGNNSVTNQSALLPSGFDSSSGTDSDKQHKKKKSDIGDETLSSDLSPVINIEQSP